MRWKLIEQNEAGRFDHFIAATEAGDILQTYSWGEVKGADWRPYRAVVEDEQGAILAAATLLVRKIPAFGRSIAYCPRGPVLNDYSDTELLRFTIHSLTELARRNKAIVLKIDPAIPDETSLPSETFEKLGFHRAGGKHEFGGLQPRHTFRLSLDDSIENILSGFPKKLRYKINFGPKNGLTFRSDEQNGIKHFYDVLSKTGERNDFFTRSPGYFEHLYDTLKKEDRVLLLTGYLADEPIVSSLTFILNDKAWAVYGGQTDSHRNLYSYHAMNWERIKWAHSRRAKWFDFYGVPGHVNEAHPLYGLYHFKKSFGGDFVSFVGEWDMPLSRPFYLLWEYGLPLYQQTIQRAIKKLTK
jgi:lipid II:glycine glycyltransferase (peptidoglycan interpeptide bridge formation enzyme)